MNIRHDRDPADVVHPPESLDYCRHLGLHRSGKPSVQQSEICVTHGVTSRSKTGRNVNSGTQLSRNGTGDICTAFPARVQRAPVPLPLTRSREPARRAVPAASMRPAQAALRPPRSSEALRRGTLLTTKGSARCRLAAQLHCLMTCRAGRSRRIGATAIKLLSKYRIHQRHVAAVSRTFAMTHEQAPTHRADRPSGAAMTILRSNQWKPGRSWPARIRRSASGRAHAREVGLNESHESPLQCQLRMSQPPGVIESQRAFELLCWRIANHACEFQKRSFGFGKSNETIIEGAGRGRFQPMPPRPLDLRP